MPIFYAQVVYRADDPLPAKEHLFPVEAETAEQALDLVCLGHFHAVPGTREVFVRVVAEFGKDGGMIQVIYRRVATFPVTLDN
jgi:hypothetical protein